MSLFGGVIPITGITFLMFSIFAIIAVGLLIGSIKVKGINLGDAGVFIVALIFGCFFYDKLEAQLPGYTDKGLKIIENLGLILFVGIPLPGTGAWTGTLLAVLLKLDKKKSFIFISLGVLLAGIIMSILSYGILGNIF